MDNGFVVTEGRKSVIVTKGNVSWYFHKKGHLQFFSKKPEGSIPIPDNLEVVLNPVSGMPMGKKKKIAN
jgi:hypothetical protein